MGFIDKNINDLELPKGVISLQQTYTKEEGIKYALVFKQITLPTILEVGLRKQFVSMMRSNYTLKELGVSLRLAIKYISYHWRQRHLHIHPKE